MRIGKETATGNNIFLDAVRRGAPWHCMGGGRHQCTRDCPRLPAQPHQGITKVQYITVDETNLETCGLGVVRTPANTRRVQRLTCISRGMQESTKHAHIRLTTNSLTTAYPTCKQSLKYNRWKCPGQRTCTRVTAGYNGTQK